MNRFAARILKSHFKTLSPPIVRIFLPSNTYRSLSDSTMASLSARRFLSHLLSRRRFLAPPPLSRLSTTTTAPPVDPPPPLYRDPSPSSHSKKEEAQSHSKAESHEKTKSKKVAGDYEEEEAKVLRSALHHVVRILLEPTIFFTSIMICFHFLMVH
jgi:hypothetical protein